MTTSDPPTPHIQPGDIVTFLASRPELRNAAATDPGFPLHVFPPIIATWLERTAATTRVPATLTAAPFLAFIGATIGNQLRLRVHPGWHEYPSLWIALVTLTGIGKTPALAATRQPFDLLHLEAWETWQRTERAPFNRLLSTASTYARVTRELQESTGLVIVRDELFGLIRAMDSRRGEDRQHFLTLWSSEPIIPTQPGTRPIPAPVASIAGGIQPTLIPRIRNHGQDGFLERFLLFFVAGKQPRWSTVPEPASPETIANLIRPLRAIDTGGTHPTGRTVTLTTSARDRWAAWYDGHTDQTFVASLLIGGFYRKLPSHLARIALILHALWNVNDPTRPLDADTIARAIDVAEYIRRHIHRTAMLLDEWESIRDPDTALAERIVQAIAKTPDPEGWTDRTAILIATGRPKPALFTRIVNGLVKSGILETTTHRTGTRGRPTTRYRLRARHPDQRGHPPGYPTEPLTTSTHEFPPSS